ncbi:DUF3311 domain-containing protein [Acidiferrimicrobium sp. IK]|uniref:DUF3311 domain-containing protein n=1 Tax=Acidiferrimicrobium sp. IK TaxID=2871700 RepID=UPI0021CB7657|nr:DUF3311 domain-containing protein [Acidiferrimicrobium sp. IK]MCU4186142.1 DUF3311 domain-containing protein [Acidiferrimicrobium sp. IK]
MNADVGLEAEPLDRGSALRYASVAVLLGATFVGLLWVPSYARVTPTLDGIPFFYWYSVLWLVVNAICQVIAYRIIHRHRPARPAAGVAR